MRPCGIPLKAMLRDSAPLPSEISRVTARTAVVNRGYEPLLGICAVVVVKDNGIAYLYGSLPAIWRSVDVFLLDAPLVNSLPECTM